MFLAGDAAHAMPPWIGQGMSAGVRDVANLCWKLAAVLRGQAPEALLDSYEAERKPHVIEVTRRAVLTADHHRTPPRPRGHAQPRAANMIRAPARTGFRSFTGFPTRLRRQILRQRLTPGGRLADSAAVGVRRQRHQCA